ncbi:MAG: hypothetical protein CMJ93_00485 [Planctomycetes bacterium]|nr:hypothetical protein [Planctomycetota bacterium]|tara:strand:+ start:1404 stop:1928 length:525 start_codon:yes stop_codon:yes gene_type:complete
MIKYAYIAAGIILILIGARLALMIKQWSLSRTLKRRREIGAQAEIDAIALIERNGYKIIEEQSTTHCSFLVNGEETNYTVRADYIAEKNEKRYVIEVKSGDVAPNPNHSATRRQLLEYAHIHRPDGLLLADMTAITLSTIEFDLVLRNQTVANNNKLIGLAFIVGIAFGVIIAN